MNCHRQEASTPPPSYLSPNRTGASSVAEREKVKFNAGAGITHETSHVLISPVRSCHLAFSTKRNRAEATQWSGVGNRGMEGLTWAGWRAGVKEEMRDLNLNLRTCHFRCKAETKEDWIFLLSTLLSLVKKDDWICWRGAGYSRVLFSRIIGLLKMRLLEILKLFLRG